MPMFTDNLQLDLTLTIQGVTFSIPGGNIKNFEVALYNYGFIAKADFWVDLQTSEDTLFPAFTTADLIDALLTVQGYYNLPEILPDPVTLKGLVYHKSLEEENGQEIEDIPVLFRRYTIHFADAAQVLWRQHFPVELYAEIKMQDVIKAHLAQGVSCEFDWAVLGIEHPLVFLSLDEENSANFYDFIFWYIDTHNGVWNYDSKNNQYKISLNKETQGTPAFLNAEEIADVKVHFPETSRHDVHVLNTYSESPQNQAISQEMSVNGARHDVLARIPIAADFEKKVSLEESRLKIRRHEVHLDFGKFPTMTFYPGCFVRFEKGSWNPTIFPKGKEYRVYELKIRGQALKQEPQTDINQSHAGYELEMSSRLELKEEPAVNMPPYETPHYPLYVEGKIVSPGGGETDRNYFFAEDKQNSLSVYHVTVPLWNKKIPVSYTPNLFPGHFYFPLYKNLRVLLALDFLTASIERCLDWGIDVRLPAETQGNHILFGQKHTSQTSLRHIYEDNKPVLNLQRVSGQDTQLVQVKEGIIILETKEDTTAEAAEETYDVTLQVESAKAELSMQAKGGMASFTGDFAAGKTEVTGQLGTAISDVSGSLEAMEADISSQIDSVKSEMKGIAAQLGAKTGALQSQVESVKSELKSQLLS